MIKAVLLILAPGATWNRIAEAQRGIFFVLTLHLLPLLALSVAGEVYGRNWLIESGRFEDANSLAQDFAWKYAAAEFIVGLLTVALGAWLVKTAAETFHRRHGYSECFSAAAYGLSPLFLLHLLNAVPVINPWIAFGVGMVLSISVLYLGVPMLLRPDPSHAFGLYLTSAILITLICGLARVITLLILEKKIPLP